VEWGWGGGRRAIKSQRDDRSGGGSCASRAAKTQSSAASSPSPRISSTTSSGVISLMSWRNWCMRLTSHKKRSAIVVVLFHDFAFDVTIFLASYVIDQRADFLGRQQHVVASDGAVQGRLDREWPHRGVKYHDRLSFCRGRYRTHAGDCCQFCSTQSGSHRCGIETRGLKHNGSRVRIPSPAPKKSSA